MLNQHDEAMRFTDVEYSTLWQGKAATEVEYGIE